MLVGILNLFGAGAETTSSTLNWALLYLSRDPDVQKKFQKEIDKVVGNSRLPSLDDKER
jgi:cytochrome P450